MCVQENKSQRSLHEFFSFFHLKDIVMAILVSSFNITLIFLILPDDKYCQIVQQVSNEQKVGSGEVKTSRHRVYEIQPCP